MQPYKRQINESFFNPLLHFIPLLLFMLVNESFGSSTALIGVYVIVVAILLYSYLLYANLYKFLGVSYLVTSVIITVIIFIPTKIFPLSTQAVLSEYIIMFSLILILLLRKTITNFVSEKTPKQLAMTNNLDEHFRIVWLLAGILFLYTGIYTFSFAFVSANSSIVNFNREIFIGLIIFIIFYEFIRVTLIRIRLFKEEWWPIVNEKGQVIGSVQSQESKSANEKFIHPIIRVILINESRIFLQKRSHSDLLCPDLWDVALSNHIRMNETVEDCINRTSIENYGVKDVKPILLSKHLNQTSYENQFVYLFLVCKLEINELNLQMTESVKWWTIQQIEDNISSGIFCENFISEYQILKRSGLLENGSYYCSCRLKEVVFQGVNKSTTSS